MVVSHLPGVYQNSG